MWPFFYLESHQILGVTCMDDYIVISYTPLEKLGYRIDLSFMVDPDM